VEIARLISCWENNAESAGSAPLMAFDYPWLLGLREGEQRLVSAQTAKVET